MSPDTETEDPDTTPAPEEPPPPPPAVGERRRRIIRVAVFALIAVLAGIFVFPKISRSQQLRLHFGIGSSRVVSATARVGRNGTWDRETTWRFDRGAPSSLVWAFDLPNGSAQVEVEVSSATAVTQQVVTLDLAGSETTVELEPTLRRLQ